jgi:hypothetical protein
MRKPRFAIFRAFCVLYSCSVFSFSGEDPINGNPWYHEVMTKEGSAKAGFDTAAGASLAWHADYVDSYLYNPLFWVQGGLSRYKVSLATEKELAKLHFDDLFSTDRVSQMWYRHMSGTIIGVLWALENNDVAAAQHVVGISCHVLQDLYAHSNWMDEKWRREKTWFEVSAAEKKATFLWTGYYEQPASLGILPHGKIAPECAVLPKSDVLDAICSAYSPFNALSVCQAYDRCAQGITDKPSELLGVSIPSNVIYFAPPGIALDSKWTSRIGMIVRGIIEPGLTGEMLFDQTRTLATRTTTQWLTILENIMATQAGGKDFWNMVKSNSTWSVKEAQFETYNKQYFSFLTAGPYPPASKSSDDGYYLKLRLKTGDVTGGGTDADIYVKAQGKEFLLDNCPRANPILAYNDFETGDDDAYVVGPFDSFPSQIIIENRDADIGDVLESLWDSFVSSLSSVFSNLDTFFLSIIGGNADLVAKNRIVWSGSTLAAITTAETPFTVRLNGGDEGDYEVYGSIKKVSSDQENSTYSIKLTTLHCISESEWDRGSNSDEPFVLALLAPLPGADIKYRTEPYNDVDDGESNSINYTFANVSVPSGFGAISLALVLMESDDESSSMRDQALNELSSQTATATADEERDFIDNLGAAVAADWYLQKIDVFAFKRGPVSPSSGIVLSSTANFWIDGGTSRSFTLNKAGMKEWPFVISELTPLTSLIRSVARVVRPRAGILAQGGFCLVDGQNGMAISVVDQLGRQVYNAQFSTAHKVRIPLSTGCYLVKIRYNDGGIETGKVIIAGR